MDDISPEPGMPRKSDEDDIKKFEMALPTPMWETARELAQRLGLRLVPWMRQLVAREVARGDAAGGEDALLQVAISARQRDAIVDLVRGALSAGWTRTAKSKENIERALEALERGAPKAD